MFLEVLSAMILVMKHMFPILFMANFRI